jgi:hypothetical protein
MLLLVLVLVDTVCAASDLTMGWRLTSSATLGGATGVDVSRGSYDASGWLKLGHFPTTVLAALASNGSAPAADFNLPLYYAQNFNEVDTAQFDVPWWYRVSIPSSAVAAAKAGGRVVLTFKGEAPSDIQYFALLH